MKRKTLSNLNYLDFQAYVGVTKHNGGFAATNGLLTHIQAGTVPLSTSSEACFTQFYIRLVRRKGDPAATTFLFGLETVALRAERVLFDLASWCRERPALAGYLRQTPASQVARSLSQPEPPADLSLEDWAACTGRSRAGSRACCAGRRAMPRFPMPPSWRVNWASRPWSAAGMRPCV
jgi:hypothetical protein